MEGNGLLVQLAAMAKVERSAKVKERSICICCPKASRTRELWFQHLVKYGRKTLVERSSMRVSGSRIYLGSTDRQGKE